MKKATFTKKLRLDKETLQSLTRDQINSARGGIQVADTGLSASCGMGCDHDTRQ